VNDLWGETAPGVQQSKDRGADRSADHAGLRDTEDIRKRLIDIYQLGPGAEHK